MRLFRYRIGGMNRFMRRLKTLSEKDAKKVLKKSLRAAGTVIAKAMRKNVPTDSKTLKKSIGVRVYVKKSTGKVYVIIGPRTKFKRVVKQYMRINGRIVFAKDAVRHASRYAHLVNKGRKAYAKDTPIYKRGRFTGKFYKRRVSAVAGAYFIEAGIRAARSAGRAAMYAKAEQEIKKLRHA